MNIQDVLLDAGYAMVVSVEDQEVTLAGKAVGKFPLSIFNGAAIEEGKRAYFKDGVFEKVTASAKNEPSNKAGCLPLSAHAQKMLHA